MKYLKVSDAAFEDLRRIVGYTREQWGEEQATMVQIRFKESLLLLQTFPGLLTKTNKPEYFVKPVSKLPFMIVCRKEEETLVVIQILHDKQNRLS